jgi:hypothetical protein
MWHAWERREKFKRFWWENPRERDHLEDQGVGGGMGSEWILERLTGGVECIQLAQDRDRWRAVVNAVMEPSGSGATKLLVALQTSRVLLIV